mgnify:CR=1 FL=1
MNQEPFLACTAPSKHTPSVEVAIELHGMLGLDEVHYCKAEVAMAMTKWQVEQIKATLETGGHQVVEEHVLSVVGGQIP